jgi:outer membrane immunogenic protein
MKRFLLSALFVASAVPALAADLPVKARPMPAPVAVWTWDGFYIGINGGYSWGRSRTSVDYFNTVTGLPIVPPAGSITDASFKLDGGVFGGQIGYNWQFSSWLFGLEADAQWSGQKGSAAFLCAPAGTVVPGACIPGLTFLPPGITGTAVGFDQRLEWFGTVRGRLGVLASPSWLLYVTGGLAYGSVKSEALLASFTPLGVAVTGLASSSTTHAGWTIGGGIEGHLGGNWTAKAEYLYMDLGTFGTTVSLPAAFVGAVVDSRVTDNIFRVGINYHFSPPAAVVARY